MAQVKNSPALGRFVGRKQSDTKVDGERLCKFFRSARSAIR